MNDTHDWAKNFFLTESVADLDDTEVMIDEIEQYVLTQKDGDVPGTFVYQAFDPDDILIGKFESKINAADLKTSEYKASTVYDIFRRVVKQEKQDRERNRKALARQQKFAKRQSRYDFDDDAYSWEDSFSTRTSADRFDNDDDEDWWLTRTPSSYSYSSYKYTPPPKSTGFLDKLNKSDTLVIHCSDPTTTMLSQVYDGRGWDVLNDGNIDKSELHQLLKSHDRIVMLGHGTSGGLINKQGGGYVIGDEEAPYLKDKKIFAIWCNADKYFKKHGIGKGQFITKNAPSEVWECRAAGCGNISAELMLENITYWCKLCGDIVEQALDGNGASGVDYVRKNYLEKYGNHPVSIYNADSASLLGVDKPLPAFEFKGEPLKPKDYPYPSYNEEEFLKNPKMSI